MKASELNTVNSNLNAERAERIMREFLAAVKCLADSIRLADSGLSNSLRHESEPQPESDLISAADAAECGSASEPPECCEDSAALDGEGVPRHRIFEEFSSDHELLERLSVTPEELQALSRSSLFGSLRGKADLLFILRQIREGSTAGAEASAAVESGPLPDELIEESPRDFKAMTERIRVAAIAILEETPQKPASSWSRLLRRRRVTLR